MSEEELDIVEQTAESEIPSTTPHEKVKLSRITRIIIYLIFAILNIILSEDFGLASSNSESIRHDLKLSHSEFGIFGILPIIGRLCGGFLFMILLELENRKLLSILTLIFNAMSLFIYLITDNKYIIYLTRFFMGTFRIYLFIYIPIWVDQFGIAQYKTLMMSIINLTSPLGHLLGYGIGLRLDKNNWRHSYEVVGIIIFIFGLSLIFFPDKYFSAKYYFSEYGDKNNVQEKLIQKKVTSQTKSILFSKYDNFEEKINTLGENKIIVKKCDIFKNPTFLFSTYAKSSILFIFSVINLFTTDYLKDNLKIKDRKIIFKYYETTSISGRIFGGLCGSIISTKLGGYENKKSLFVILGFGVFSFAMIFPLAKTLHFIIFIISLFAFFFFTSATLPTLIGYIISSVPNEHKGIGSCINILSSNLLGNILGPILYGFVEDTMKSKCPGFAWRCTMYYYFFGFSGILFACLFKFRDFTNADKDSNKIDFSVSNRTSKSEDAMLMEDKIPVEESNEDE